jgi:hypothetical protein
VNLTPYSLTLWRCSATMTVGEALVNRPSDATGERPIGDAVVILP